MEVKRQYAMLVLGWVTASVHYSCLMASWLMPVDRNTFRACFPTENKSYSTTASNQFLQLQVIFITGTVWNIQFFYVTWLADFQQET